MPRFPSRSEEAVQVGVLEGELVQEVDLVQVGVENVAGIENELSQVNWCMGVLDVV